MERIIKDYPSPRRTGVVYADELPEDAEEEQVEDYPVRVFVSREAT